VAGERDVGIVADQDVGAVGRAVRCGCVVAVDRVAAGAADRDIAAATARDRVGSAGVVGVRADQIERRSIGVAVVEEVDEAVVAKQNVAARAAVDRVAEIATERDVGVGAADDCVGAPEGDATVSTLTTMPLASVTLPSSPTMMSLPASPEIVSAASPPSRIGAAAANIDRRRPSRTRSNAAP
jgi:hypothetical protein